MNAPVDLARPWLAKAENDLLHADNNLQSEIIPYDTVCFYWQQVAEKLFKVYRVARGVQSSEGIFSAAGDQQVCPDGSDRLCQTEASCLCPMGAIVDRERRHG
jgi:hypothetical protein